MKYYWLTLTTLLTVLAGSILSTTLVGAVEVPDAPVFDRPVVDQTQTLSEQQITELSQKINQARAEKSVQLAIAIIPTLEGESLENYSIEVARKWGVGESELSNGVLLLVVKDDRKVRIEVGRGLEGDLTDAQSGRIIRNIIAPAFQKNDYYGGISRASDEIMATASGRPSANPSPVSSASDNIASMLTVALFFLLPFGSWVAAILARSRSWWAGGVLGGLGGTALVLIFGFASWVLACLVLFVGLGLLLDYTVSKNYKKSIRGGYQPSWWIGGGGFGGGRGGRGGFGGGGFGGGGASGGW